jgi:hypothetical protein
MCQPKMTVQNALPQVNLVQFADRISNEMVPLGTRFRYYCASLNLSEDDRREYLDEPVAALPPVIAARLPEVRILLVPYLERGPHRARSAPQTVVTSRKPDARDALTFGSAESGGATVLAFAVKDAEVADHHYRFYHALAEIVAGHTGRELPEGYGELLRAELTHDAHGEVDEASWRLKSELTGRDLTARASKRFLAYARESFVDTLTLYLHGLCCDIDVETGPRQIPSNLLRKRLALFKQIYPPPQGYAVFPEDL